MTMIKSNLDDFATGKPPTDFPKLISIETIGTCNAKCTFCPHPLLNKNADSTRMSEEIFIKLIEECTQYRELENITLSFQNEPLTDPKIFKRIGYVRQKTNDAVTITIVTNASLLTKNRLDELVENPPDILKISFNGIEAKDYENLMVGLKFNRVLANIDALLERTKNMKRPAIQINSVLTREVEEIGVRRVVEFWAKRGIPVHIMNVENRAGMLIDSQQEFSGHTWNLRTWCKRPEEQLSVWPNGDVALCCADWKKDVVLGNVGVSSLHEIWHGETLSYYRKRLRTGNIADLFLCNSCMAAEIEFEGEIYKEFGKKAEILYGQVIS